MFGIRSIVIVSFLILCGLAALSSLAALSLAVGSPRAAAAAAGTRAASDADENGSHAACRIGIYDSRAIAIAYAGSKHNDVSGKMKELEKAKAAGDQKKIDELNAWGRRHQHKLHLQGFARVPVTDLLEPVKAQLPALAERLGVSAIAFECNYLDPKAGVETIDITMDLVKLYEPGDQAMKWIKDAMKKPPVGLDEVNDETP